jgi:hypothetical protein
LKSPPTLTASNPAYPAVVLLPYPQTQHCLVSVLSSILTASWCTAPLLCSRLAPSVCKAARSKVDCSQSPPRHPAAPTLGPAYPGASTRCPDLAAAYQAGCWSLSQWELRTPPSLVLLLLLQLLVLLLPDASHHHQWSCDHVVMRKLMTWCGGGRSPGSQSCQSACAVKEVNCACVPALPRSAIWNTAQ